MDRPRREDSTQSTFHLFTVIEREREREGEKIVIRSKTLNIKQIYCKERIKYKMRKKNSKKYI